MTGIRRGQDCWFYLDHVGKQGHVRRRGRHRLSDTPVAAQQGFRSLQYFVVIVLERPLGHGGSAPRDS